jgi:hypothetical protein
VPSGRRAILNGETSNNYSLNVVLHSEAHISHDGIGQIARQVAEAAAAEPLPKHMSLTLLPKCLK